MWIVLDNNQAQEVSVKRANVSMRPKGFTIPPLVLIDAWLRSRSGTASWLDDLPHRVGLEMKTIMDTLAFLDAEEISKFKTVGPHPDALTIAVLRDTSNPDEAAMAIKDGHRRFVQYLQSVAEQARERLATVPGFTRIESWPAVQETLAQGAESFLGSLVFASVSNGGYRLTRLVPERLYLAVMQN